MLSKCKSGMRYETNWVSATVLWNELGNNMYQDMQEQINRRCKGKEFKSREQRGEYEPDKVKRDKITRGLTGEYFVYYIMNKLMPGTINPPRDEGPSWDPDLYFKTGDTIECKTVRGFLDFEWRKKVKQMNEKQKKQYFWTHAPGPFFQYADKDGIQSRQNTDIIFRKTAKPTEYVAIIRSVIQKNTMYYKLSGIVRKQDIQKDMNTYFEDIQDDRFILSKKRLSEDKLMQSDIPWYRPAKTVENTVLPVREFDMAEFPPLGSTQQVKPVYNKVIEYNPGRKIIIKC